MTVLSSGTALPPDVARIQRRTLVVLCTAQIVSGIGVAVGVALSSLVAARLSGSEAIGGLAGTAAVLGAALLALPVARLGTRSGRRAGLTLAYGTAALGALAATAAVPLGSWPLLLAGLVLFGGGSAGNLAARYSAADLAPPGSAARHLSLVVWATTVGSVAGPNLAEPAGRAFAALGLPVDAGGFAVAAIMYLLSAAVIAAALRPDPLRVARSLRAGEAGAAEPGPAGKGTAGKGTAGKGAAEEGGPAGARRPGTLRLGWRAVRDSLNARRAIAGIAVSHTAMVSIMSMTPIHLDHGGAAISVIGVVISVHIAGMYVFSPIVGRLADRFGRTPVLLAGMAQLLAATALAGSSAPHGVAQVTAGLFLLGTGWSCGLVAGSALLTESAPVERRPAVQGLSDLLMNVCGAGGTVVAGLVVKSASYGVLGAAVAVLVVAAACWLAATGRRAHLASA
nr:MAG: MFS transporter [Actinomycetota bacterium]